MKIKRATNARTGTAIELDGGFFGTGIRWGRPIGG